MLGVLSVGALSASAEPAPVPDSTYSCIFQGLTGSITAVDPPVGGITGVEDVATDLMNENEPGVGDQFIDDPLDLLDEDSGTYTFSGGGFGTDNFPPPVPPTDPDFALCHHLDSDSEFLDDDNGSGIVAIAIDTEGVYVNSICGTGIAHNTDDPGAAVISDAIGNDALNGDEGYRLLAPVAGDALTSNPFELPVTDVHYEIAFVGGQGNLMINNAINTDGTGDSGEEDGETGPGGFPPGVGGTGFVNITPRDTDPTPGTEPCVNEDVNEFLVTGAFNLTLTENGEDAAGHHETGGLPGDGANEEN